MPKEHEELISVPQDLTLVSDADISDLEARAVAEFDRINAPDFQVTPNTLEYAAQLADDIDRIRATQAARRAESEERARQEQAKNVETAQLLTARVHGPETVAASGELLVSRGNGADAATIARSTAEGTVAAMLAILGNRHGQLDVAAVTERATAQLATRSRPRSTPPPATKLGVTAGVDIPGVARGGDLPSMEALIDAFQRRAKAMPVTRDNPNEQLVATVRNEHQHVVDDRTQPGQVEELFKYLTSEDKKQALVAGGGWCAPSETRYDFFNIACETGMIDLPTFGVSRGGVRFPISPSLADAVGSNAFAPFAVSYSNSSVPWLWTETDDILTVTGTTNKPCMRVPCPTFDEVRLECYGVCLTAGNLTDSAYPEATANTIRLLMAAHAHAMNARIIAQMVSLSSTAITGGDFATATNPVYQQLLGGLDLAATDYRARYGMCDDDILEVVAPYWLKATVRADLAWRTGGGRDLLSVSDAEINQYFSDRGVRVQWVNDYQVRTSGKFGHSTAMTNWPTTADVLIYAAGTFVLGNGMTLDLGVVRDSTLNAENDHTAAWSEECHLVAMVGHESRRYTIAFNVNGGTNQSSPASPPYL